MSSKRPHSLHFIGIGQCDSPFGMEDGNIDDNQITASSIYNASSQASQARLRLASSNTTVGAWCAARNTLVGKRVYSIPKKKEREKKNEKKRNPSKDDTN